MKNEDRHLIIHYLNNIMKGPLSPQLQENLWDWAERNGHELFRLGCVDIQKQMWYNSFI